MFIKLNKKLIIVVIAFFLFGSNVSFSAIERPTVLLVDKKTNTLNLAFYNNDSFNTIKTYRATFGKSVGDKFIEGDLKTPEGIYFFNAFLRPPQIKPKFGVMAFYMDYPNSIDSLVGRTGSDIMLHATNEPERLKKDRDSEGCIVVDNQNIQEIKPYVRLGLTPILVFSELKEEFLKPKNFSDLRLFFSQWLKDWNQKKIDFYIDHYHDEFQSKNMNRRQWKHYKSALNNKYGEIEINASNIQFFQHPKYSVIVFKQNYLSKWKNGRVAYQSTSTKKLYVLKEFGKYNIASEEVTNRFW